MAPETERDMETLIGYVLLIGVMLSVALIIAGLVWSLAAAGSLGTTYEIKGTNLSGFLAITVHRIAIGRAPPRNTEPRYLHSLADTFHARICIRCLLRVRGAQLEIQCVHLHRAGHTDLQPVLAMTERVSQPSDLQKQALSARKQPDEYNPQEILQEMHYDGSYEALAPDIDKCENEPHDADGRQPGLTLVSVTQCEDTARENQRHKQASSERSESEQKVAPEHSLL